MPMGTKGQPVWSTFTKVQVQIQISGKNADQYRKAQEHPLHHRPLCTGPVRQIAQGHHQTPQITISLGNHEIHQTNKFNPQGPHPTSPKGSTVNVLKPVTTTRPQRPRGAAPRGARSTFVAQGKPKENHVGGFYVIGF